MLKAIAWALLKPVIKTWLRDRALHIPVHKAAEIAKKANIPIEAVGLVNDMVIEGAMQEIEKFKP